MLKPILVIAALMIAVGLATCSVRREVIFRSASGRPMDWLGDSVRCLKCNVGGVRAGDEYDYHCPHCGAKYRARWNDETKQIEMDW